MENIDYSCFINTCQTGDLLLYSSKKWYSYFIELAGWSKYSHVSIIIRDPTWINPEFKGLYIFESGIENVNDVINNEHICGVQLVKLEDALKYYENGINGNVYYIKNNFERTDDFNTNLKHIIIKNDDKPYDINILDWIGAKFNLRIVHRNTIRFFCSALVGYVFTQLNLLPSDTDWTIIPPKAYSYYENYNKSRLQFINSCIEPEKLISNYHYEK